jgi:putative glutathione S-transferase
MSVVDPLRDERGWTFSGGEYIDPVNGFGFLGEAYEIMDPGYEGRFSVPVLWDVEAGRIVNNESADILRMFSTGRLV